MAVLLDQKLSKFIYRFTGGIQEFNTPFALGVLSVSHVFAYVDGELDGEGNIIYRDVVFDQATSTTTVMGDIPDGGIVNIERTVPKTNMYISFSSGADVSRTNLDESVRYTMMALHEVIDGRIEYEEVQEAIQQTKWYADRALISANAAQTWAGEAELSAAQAALYAAPRVDSSMTIEADTVLTYGPGPGHIQPGDYVSTKAEGHIYEVLPLVAASWHRATAGGVLLNVSPGNPELAPSMFGAFGATSVGDINVVGTGDIPDETVALQAMLDFAMLYGVPVTVGHGDRDYGISASLLIRPQADRNRGNINAQIAIGPLALHFSNYPSVTIRNPANARIVALVPMLEMIRVSNPTSFISTAPYRNLFDRVKLDGAGNATIGIVTEWSYRNHFEGIRVSGCDYGCVTRWDAGSRWQDCEIDCTEAAIWWDNAGDNAVEGGDIYVRKHGIRAGGGNNTRVRGVTFTGHAFDETSGDRIAVKLFGGSSVVADYRTRGVKIRECEAVGVDWLVHGNDGDADGKKEIWGVNIDGNHLVRNSYRPDIGLVYLRNAYGISINGNSHGDVLNAAGEGVSIYLESCDNFAISDTIQKVDATAIHLKSCRGGRIASVFEECCVSAADPIVLLEDTTDVTITGSSGTWIASSPAATAFVQETGTSNRNRAMGNAIETSKLIRPYIRMGAQSKMEHEYYGTHAYAGATIGGASGTAFLVAVPGARLGDIGEVVFETDLLGLQADVQVRGNDSARVTLRNETGASQTIPACTVTVSARSR